MQQRTYKTFTNPWYFLALGFGSGLAKKAPGTFGTIAAIPPYLLMSQFSDSVYVAIVVASLIFGIWLCEHVAKDMQVKDPGCIVWDEFVGLWITLFMLPDAWYWIVIGFVAFRIFDILKPWPVSWADKQLAGGAGIMLDDVIAGLYALAVVQILFALMKYVI